MGELTAKAAELWGAVGPPACTSGLMQDIRRAEQYAEYDRLIFDVPVQTSGDVFARAVARALVFVQSPAIIEQALQQIPVGPIRV